MKRDELKLSYTKDSDTGCWVWKDSGKVKVWFEGKSWYIHRLLWSLVKKTDIPEGKALHRVCNTQECVNPAHHEIVSIAVPILPHRKVPKKLKEAKAIYEVPKILALEEKRHKNIGIRRK